MNVNLLGGSLNIGEENADVFDVLFVEESISVLGVDWHVQFSDWELVLFDEVIIDAGEICSTIN